MFRRRIHYCHAQARRVRRGRLRGSALAPVTRWLGCVTLGCRALGTCLGGGRYEYLYSPKGNKVLILRVSSLLGLRFHSKCS